MADTTLSAPTDETIEDRWNRPRGPVFRPNGRTCIGRVGAPPGQEATGRQFYFWVPNDAVVEETQLVVCESLAADRTCVYYGVIDDVRRQSRKRNMSGEVDEADGDLNYEPPFKPEGITYARVAVLRTDPPVITPPRERSEVFLANGADARLAYQADEIKPGRELSVGLVRNGGEALVGPGVVDLDYLLGVNGGHLNVNGSAGRGTKSSYLLTINWLLLNEARRQQRERPSDPDRLRIVPIILNVKGFDLFYIDRANRSFNPARHLADWRALGFDDPVPFTGVTFYAAQQPGSVLPVPIGREGIRPYSWSLGDIVSRGLLAYLFAEGDAQDANFGALVLDLEGWLTDEQVESDGSVTRRLRDDEVATFDALLKWMDGQIALKEDGRSLRNHHLGTWRKVYRRLMKLVVESRGVLRRYDRQGNPLEVARADTTNPTVVDLAALAGEPELQRFVVAAIFRQLVEARTGANRVRGLIYLIMLDELNRFAPRAANDAITRLIETVAAEMRSQGIILLGAQQQASKVSEKVIENSAIRVLGRTGTLELNTPTWRALSESARAKAASLRLDEKLVIQDTFREPMHIRVPYPAWAMNPDEAVRGAAGGADDVSDSDVSDLIEG